MNMTIEKLASGSYRARKMVNGKRHTIVLPYKPTEKELTILFAEKFQENTPKEHKGSFLHYANDYISNRSNVLSPATIRTYNIKLNQISEGFKAKNIYDITPQDIQREINVFSANHAPKTTKTLHGFISSILAEYRPNMVLRTKLPTAIEDSQYEPNTKDIKALLELAKGTRYSIPFQLGVLGLRRGEICALELSDLNGCELHVHRDLVYNKKWILKETPKTETSNRTIVIPESLAEEIREAGAIYDGHPNALNKAIHKFQQQLGIDQFKFHSLRSYFVSYCHANNIPDLDVMYMGGWKTDSVMKKAYRKAMKESMNKSMAKISSSILS